MVNYKQGYTPYDYGYNAYLNGKNIDQCPYERGSAECYAWTWGFDDAKEENKGERSDP
jgi:ribosome modulation factor